MTDFTNAVFEVIAGGIAMLVGVVAVGWLAVVWTALTDARTDAGPASVAHTAIPQPVPRADTLDMVERAAA